MSEELSKKEVKGLEGELKHCPFCGDEWEESDKTNKKILCSCGITFKVIRYG